MYRLNKGSIKCISRKCEKKCILLIGGVTVLLSVGETLLSWAVLVFTTSVLRKSYLESDNVEIVVKTKVRN